MHKHTQLDHTLALLAGDEVSFPIDDKNIIQHGTTTAAMAGGNLSLFQYLPQTFPDDAFKGKIIFLEDCNEELSRIDRMLMHLKRLGVFKDAAALVFGQFINLQDSSRPFGYTLQDIIEEHTEGLDTPILHNMPFGHGKDLYTMPIGVDVILDTKKQLFKLKKPAVNL